MTDPTPTEAPKPGDYVCTTWPHGRHYSTVHDNGSYVGRMDVEAGRATVEVVRPATDEGGMVTREDLIEALMEKGKTREQAEAFLDLAGSAFRRRGWAEGEPLTQDQIGERLDTFMGTDEIDANTTPGER